LCWQARHFTNITFPNLVYNPYKDIGYSMELFLESNFDPARPMFLCGGWYSPFSLYIASPSL